MAYNRLLLAVVIAVIFIVVAVQKGSSLSCIKCNSFVDPECESNPKQKRFEVECGDNATSCRKMEQEIYYEDDYHTRTIRQCANESGPMKCIERTGTYRIKIYYCHCNTEDNCNGAGVVSLSVLLAAVCGAMAFLFSS